MARTVPIDVRIADLPQMQAFIAAVSDLIGVLAGQEGLQQQVTGALARVQQATAGLGGTSTRPAAGPSEEDLIRRAMTEAWEHPGRTVTVTDSGAQASG